MKYLDLTLPTPEANLACDEALLDGCEEGYPDEILRTWESPAPFVVVGYANRAAREVNLPACRARIVPVLRRCSGGGTVLQGPGCLNYALILRIGENAALASIPGTNQYVMEKHRNLFQELLRKEIKVRGHTDLAHGDRKFSGNAQRRKRQFLLFHGSFLLHLDLALIQELLPPPSKEPVYRAGRSHQAFLENLLVPSGRLKQLLREAWQATDQLPNPPWGRIGQLVKEKYAREEWNLRF